MIFAYFGLKVNNFLRFPVWSNDFCLLWSKRGFEVIISLDFLFKVMIFANFTLKVNLLIFLDFLFKVMTFTYFTLKVNLK